MLQAPTRGQPQSRRLVLVRTSCWQQLPACSKAGGKLWRDKGGEESWGAPAPAAAMQGGSTGPFPSQLNRCWGTRGNGAAGGDLCKLGLLHFYGHHQLLTALVLFCLHSTSFLRLTKWFSQKANGEIWEAPQPEHCPPGGTGAAALLGGTGGHESPGQAGGRCSFAMMNSTRVRVQRRVVSSRREQNGRVSAGG